MLKTSEVVSVRRLNKPSLDSLVAMLRRAKTRPIATAVLNRIRSEYPEEQQTARDLENEIQNGSLPHGLDEFTSKHEAHG